MDLESSSNQEIDSQLNRVFLTVADHLEDIVEGYKADQMSQ